MPFTDLFDHYAKHTGEFAYECIECNLPFADKYEIITHRKKKSCKGKKFRTLYLYPKNLKTIYLHCCKLCNFVQLNEANTFRHLRDHHNKVNDDSSYIERIILCSICDDYTNNKENVNNLQHDLSALNSNDIIVHNEPLCEDISVGEEDTFEFDIKPTTKNVYIPGSFKQECILNADNKHFDKHQPILLKTEENNFDRMQNDYESIMSFGFYKCSAVECSYTTDNDKDMYKHLNDHLNSFLPAANVLKCAYCSPDNDVFSSPNKLITHTKKHHSSKRYYCSSCDYRSCTKDNVLVHFQINHIQNQQTCDIIYESIGPQIDFNHRKKYMLDAMEKNVQPLFCKCKF